MALDFSEMDIYDTNESLFYDRLTHESLNAPYKIRDSADNGWLDAYCAVCPVPIALFDPFHRDEDQERAGYNPTLVIEQELARVSRVPVVEYNPDGFQASKYGHLVELDIDVNDAAEIALDVSLLDSVMTLMM
ncbi:hypothetical protein BP5796_11164 [Coleophoma crateriformis]|uniref:Uncharacterized protein n=1 Tax=Coleophoma crateriformis TaxID=565419 RepID=A0A3D8QM40_9HELO|nr:hypothetical protein BP5796_11164 [Coleophoma crateriformis]